MEQRPLRLGDLVDDYCPRERRVTNHAIVAIVGESIRQTRCMTCDADHVFKSGKAPLRRPKGDATPGADDNAGGQLVTPREVGAVGEPESEDAIATVASSTPAEPEAPATADASNAESDDDRVQEAWPANRTLIRASLPRTDGEPPP